MKCENTFAVAARAELLKLQRAHGSPGDLVRMQSQPACASASPTSSRETRVPLAMDQVPQSSQQSKARASPNAMLTGSPVTIRKKKVEKIRFELRYPKRAHDIGKRHLPLSSPRTFPD